MPTDKLTFEEMIQKYRDRMETLRDTFNQQGYLYAESKRDPSYAIFLTRMGEEFNVHSFRNGEPVGHRDYDRLEGGGPVQNALAEFIGDGWKLGPRPGR